MKIDPKVYLIVPCFNESKRFSQYYFKEILELPGVELIFVNDGSTDNTLEILENFTSIKGGMVLSFPQNIGKANSVRKGMLSIAKNVPPNADYFIGFLDADGAYSLKSVSNLVTLLDAESSNAYDVFISSRIALGGRAISRTFLRHYLGRIIVTGLGVKFRGIPYDPQAGLKIFRVTDVFVESLQRPFQTRWFGDLELFSRLQLISEVPHKIWEEPADAWNDVEGSKVKFSQFLRILNELIFILFLPSR
jgi:glycosyltransferase involved in cell wall biosynthesis